MTSIRSITPLRKYDRCSQRLSAQPGSFRFHVHLVLCIAVVALSDRALAEVYQCIDEESGKITFTDKACPKNLKGGEIEVKSDYASQSEHNAAVQEKRNSSYKFPARKPEVQPTATSISRCEDVIDRYLQLVLAADELDKKARNASGPVESARLTREANAIRDQASIVRSECPYRYSTYSDAWREEK